MTPEEFHDKWVDPYHMIGPNDKARELCLEDAKEMIGEGPKMSFEKLFESVAPLFDGHAVSYYTSAMQELDRQVAIAKQDRIPI